VARKIEILARALHRQLIWDGCVNVRDLGGLPTEDGRQTLVGVVVRSDSPSYLNEVGLGDLQAYGVRTIVDLRLPDEAGEFPYPFVTPGDHGIQYSNISFIDPDLPVADGITDLASDYTSMLDRFGHQVLEIVRTIANAPPGCVLVHCTAGKDRTGLISALLLDLVGVAPEVIAADYALTGEQRRAVTDEYLVNGPGTRAEREDWLRYTWPYPRVMAAVLDHLAMHYDRAEGYLRTIGLSEAEIQSLRERLVGSDRDTPSPGLDLENWEGSEV